MMKMGAKSKYHPIYYENSDDKKNGLGKGVIYYKIWAWIITIPTITIGIALALIVKIGSASSYTFYILSASGIIFYLLKVCNTTQKSRYIPQILWGIGLICFLFFINLLKNQTPFISAYAYSALLWTIFIGIYLQTNAYIRYIKTNPPPVFSNKEKGIISNLIILFVSFPILLLIQSDKNNMPTILKFISAIPAALLPYYSILYWNIGNKKR